MRFSKISKWLWTLNRFLELFWLYKVHNYYFRVKFNAFKPDSDCAEAWYIEQRGKKTVSRPNIILTWPGNDQSYDVLAVYFAEDIDVIESFCKIPTDDSYSERATNEHCEAVDPLLFYSMWAARLPRKLTGLDVLRFCSETSNCCWRSMRT